MYENNDNLVKLINLKIGGEYDPYKKSLINNYVDAKTFFPIKNGANFMDIVVTLL